jgi:hypothetical protein
MCKGDDEGEIEDVAAARVLVATTTSDMAGDCSMIEELAAGG